MLLTQCTVSTLYNIDDRVISFHHYFCIRPPSRVDQAVITCGSDHMYGSHHNITYQTTSRMDQTIIKCGPDHHYVGGSDPRVWIRPSSRVWIRPSSRVWIRPSSRVWIRPSSRVWISGSDHHHVCGSDHHHVYGSVDQAIITWWIRPSSRVCISGSDHRHVCGSDHNHVCGSDHHHVYGSVDQTIVTFGSGKPPVDEIMSTRADQSNITMWTCWRSENAGEMSQQLSLNNRWEWERGALRVCLIWFGGKADGNWTLSVIHSNNIFRNVGTIFEERCQKSPLLKSAEPDIFI